MQIRPILFVLALGIAPGTFAADTPQPVRMGCGLMTFDTVPNWGLAPDGKSFVFLSEAIENIPRGWRAKESYRIVSDSEFTETFELAPPGKPFATYSQVALRKKK